LLSHGCGDLGGVLGGYCCAVSAALERDFVSSPLTWSVINCRFGDAAMADTKAAA
jgi:hypothetical protein